MHSIRLVSIYEGEYGLVLFKLASRKVTEAAFKCLVHFRIIHEMVPQIVVQNMMISALAGCPLLEYILIYLYTDDYGNHFCLKWSSNICNVIYASIDDLTCSASPIGAFICDIFETTISYFASFSSIRSGSGGNTFYVNISILNEL